MGIADGCSPEVGARHEAIDERRLPHPAVAAKQRDLPVQQRTQFLHAVALLCRHLTALIAEADVKRDHHLLVAQQVVVEQIGLVEHQDHWHAVGLSRSQEAVDKGGGGLRTGHGDNQESLIDVSGQDMTLLRQVDALADDVVAAIVDIGNPADPLLTSPRRGRGKRYTVANRHGIGTPDAFYPEVSLHLTVKQLAIVRADGVPATCILDDKSFHFSLFTFH